MKKWFVFFSVVGCGVLSNIAQLTAEEEIISFSEAREIILSRNAGLKSLRTEIDAAKAGVTQAGVLPNPGIGVALENFGANEIEAGIEQTIELGGKRRLRTEAAQQEVDKALNAHQIAQSEIEAEIVRRFIPIVTTQSKLALIDSILTITEATRDQIQRRIESGVSRKTDLVRIEIDIEQLQLERNVLLRENEQARLKFAALGSNQDTALMNVAGELDNELAIPDLTSFPKAIEANPVLGTYSIEQEQLEIQRKQHRADAIPDLNLSAGYLRNNVEKSSSPLLGLSITIPLYNRNTAAQKQIMLKQQAARERRENAFRLLWADIREMHSRLEVVDTKIQFLRSSTLPKAQHVYAMLQEYYNAGSAGFLDLAETQAQMLRLKLKLIDLEQDRAHGLADLMQATATNFEIVK